MNKQLQKGFTLIELVVVIAILAILAGVAIPKFIDITTEARKAAFKADIGTLKAGISTFAAEKAVTTGKLTYPSKSELGASDTTKVFAGVLELPAANDFRERGWTYDATAGTAEYTGGGTSAIGKFTYDTGVITITLTPGVSP